MIGSMKKTIVLAAAVAVWGSARANLDAAANAETLHVIRELGVDGQPTIWNGHAIQFMYPPQFDFKAVAGAVKYRFTAIDDMHREFAMEAARPTEPLTSLWTNLTDNGFVTVTALGLDAKGEVCGLAGTRRFWKMARYRPGTYPTARRSYGEASRMAFDYIFERPSTQYFLKYGKPDPEYGLNAYPARMHAGLICGMVRYAKVRPDRAADALKVARNAADYLISISLPADAVLAHFPPTYDNPKAGPGLGGVGPSSQGKNMLIYPASAGTAYLDLYAACGDAKYLEAAKGIAETYLKIQGADGTCALKVDEKTGEPVSANRAFPVDICSFLERLAALTGRDDFRKAAARGLDFVLKGPVKDWDWEGQFEDTELVGKYVNQTLPCETVLYLLARRGKEGWVRRFAREALRFSEDQFVCWERPCREDGTGPISKQRGNDAEYLTWCKLGVLEQYKCYVPIDAPAAKLVRTYFAMWRETGDALDLAKARTIADAMVNQQFDNGRIPTFWAEYYRDKPLSDWLCCMVESAIALEEIGKIRTLP